jgi:putative membrane protein (TIGR04086 family)
MITSRIHWGRLVLAAFFTELAIFAVFIPVLIRYGEDTARYTVPPLALVTTFLFSVWTGRRVESRFVLHGILVGIVATLMYVALTFAQPEPFIYIVAHGLKILGGAAGGRVAEKRRQIVGAPGSASPMRPIGA